MLRKIELRESVNRDFKIHIKNSAHGKIIYNNFVGFQSLSSYMDIDLIADLYFKAYVKGLDKCSFRPQTGLIVTFYSK